MFFWRGGVGAARVAGGRAAEAFWPAIASRLKDKRAREREREGAGGA